MREGVEHPKLDHFIGDQVESPTRCPGGRITAGDQRHLGFHSTIDLYGSPTAGRLLQQLPQGVVFQG